MPSAPLVSVIIPAFAAGATIARAVRSLLAQSYQQWEAIVVADDQRTYRPLLAEVGLDDARLRYASTGRIAAGPSVARNVGVAEAAGAVVAPLDADDTYAPERLATLVPLALERGAATDNVRVIDEATGHQLSTAFAVGTATDELDAAQFLGMSVPLMFVLAREYLVPWDEDIPFAEDIVFNARVYERLASVPISCRSLRDYYVRAGSAAHAPDSGARAASAYRHIRARLDGDGLGFDSDILRQQLARAIDRKIALNTAFARAHRAGECANFQEFVARQGGADALPTRDGARP